MSSAAEINGIWITNKNMPVDQCDMLVRSSDRKKNALPEFSLYKNETSKIVCRVTGKEKGRRIFFRATLYKIAHATSLLDLGETGSIDIMSENKDIPIHVTWNWPKAAGWNEPGEYHVKIALGTSEGPDLKRPPRWDLPVLFAFEVVNF
ncbi:MAG: hypothetical protein M0Q92_08015 [Methanoregula sp.]|jgi:hypothetical protein|nr:hypothetical protein [Methanoregula sp.]